MPHLSRLHLAGLAGIACFVCLLWAYGSFALASLIFVGCYAAIVSEKVHKTKVALLGAALTLVLKVLDQHDALHNVDLGVDWNVVFLLISMMIMVNILTKTGVFQFLAVRSAKVAQGRPIRIMVIFAVVTALLSALLDNVTTVLLIAPVTLLIAQELDLDPVPYLITEALASNIGGTATLIGDPPNIMIASKAGFDFMDFIVHLAPAIVVVMGAWLAVWVLVFARRLTVSDERRERIMAMDEGALITDPALLRKAGAILGLTILGFMLHGVLGYEPATVALAGAAALLFVSGQEPHEALAEVEWPTIFFFIGLFIIVGGTVKAGVIEWLARQMLAVTAPTPQDTFLLSMVMVWFSGLASAIVDNIPYVATMNPLILDLSHQLFGSTDPAVLHGPAMLPVWWSLALGACLGGNGTAIGASANVIVVGMAEKAGHKVSFVRFLAYGMPAMLLTVAISSVYIWLRYY